MRFMETAGVLALVLALGGCFQSTTTLRVNADRSGTLEQRTVFTGAAITQLQQLASLGGQNGSAPELLSEQQARAMAANLGPGVRYVSSTPIKTATTEGRDTIYAFADIDALKISQQPSGLGGITVRAGNLPRQDITFTLEPQPDGNQLLRIHMPDMRKLPIVPGAAGATEPSIAAATSQSHAPDAAAAPPVEAPTAEQLAMARQMFAGMRMTIAVEPAGTVVKSSSPYVDGNRVTLLDVDFDRIAASPGALQRLQALRGVTTPQQAQAVLQGLPGVKAVVDREVTIEFAPGK